MTISLITHQYDNGFVLTMKTISNGKFYSQDTILLEEGADVFMAFNEENYVDGNTYYRYPGPKDYITERCLQAGYKEEEE